MDSLGLYVSIPFCRAKCTFCNFASDSFAPGRLPAYIETLTREIAHARHRATAIGAPLPELVTTLYLGGGTPSLLSADQVQTVFHLLKSHFTLAPDAEITLEAAPGQLADPTLEAFQHHGVNRLSFGVQSFIDRETAAIGRLHTAAQCLAELDRVRRAGIPNLCLDLIAGLPHQTEASWLHSLDQAIATGVPHLSVYLLELDEDSRLGREALSSGTRYGAAALPTDDDAAHFYELACARLETAGIPQYEISNFAHPGHHSRHNLKYWHREPYLGLGLDAHSMLLTPDGATLRFSNPDDLDRYAVEIAHREQESRGQGSGSPHTKLEPAAASSTHPIAPPPALTILSTRHTPTAACISAVDRLTDQAVLEETLFLGLRTNDGLSTADLARTFPASALAPLAPIFQEAERDGLLRRTNDRITLTPHGRLLSNEVFGRLLAS